VNRASSSCNEAALISPPLAASSILRAAARQTLRSLDVGRELEHVGAGIRQSVGPSRTVRGLVSLGRQLAAVFDRRRPRAYYRLS
jgi:hypothetical protein